MNIVRVEYKNSKTIDTAIVPEDRLLNKCDSVMVDTNHGKEPAVCLSKSIKINITNKDNITNLFEALGISYPTIHVIGKFTYTYDEWGKI